LNLSSVYNLVKLLTNKKYPHFFEAFVNFIPEINWKKDKKENNLTKKSNIRKSRNHIKN
jgi:hypothetical protein